LSDKQKLNADELSARLVEFDANLESGDNQPDETIASLKAELDTLANMISGKPARGEFEEESGCMRVTDLVKKIGREPSQAGQASPTATHVDPQGSQQQPPEELGAIREYQLLSKLGQGGMGAVYKALHKSLEKVVALKVLTNEHFDATAVARFQREMKAVGKLDHPNIVRAMDAGEFEGRHFLVMELVNGCDLSEILKTHRKLEVADACELVRQAAIGLQEAHEHDMVHSDIKPSNLMLSVKKRKSKKKAIATVKILDMGLALLADPGADNDELTGTGVLMGTIDYMAPEQATDTHTVDIRADIYSLGATLYKLLAGVSPYQDGRYDSAVKKILALVNDTPPSVHTKRTNLPPELVSLVDRMMAKEKADRPATPEEVAEALAPFAVGHNIAALVTGAPKPEVDESLEGTLSISADSLETDMGEVDASGDSPVDAASETDVSPHSVTLEPGSTVFPELKQQEPKVSSRQRKSSDGGKGVPPWLYPALAGGGAIALLIAAIVFFLPTKNGTLRVEINDPAIEVSIKGTDIVLTGADKAPVTLIPGEHVLHVTRGDFEFDTNKLVLKKGDNVVVMAELIDSEIRLVTSEGLPLGSHSIADPTTVKPPTSDALPTSVEPAHIPSGPGQYALKFEFETPKSETASNIVKGVEVPTLTHAMITQKSMTLELWVKRDAANLGCWAFAQFGKMGLSPSAGSHSRPINYRWFKGAIVTDDRSAEANETWTHLAAVEDWEKKENRFFVDGKLVGKESFDPEKRYGATSEPLILAIQMQGMIGETRVSSIPRYEKNFVPTVGHKPDEHTLVLYKFDEGEGNVLKDSSGNNHHGKISLEAKWVKIDSQTTNSPPLAVAPFDAAKAKQHQQSWAEHLGVPVEYTNSVGMKFALIPPGEFFMGSTAEDIKAMQASLPTANNGSHQKIVSREAPRHKVTLTKPFYMGIHEVTRTQYHRISGENPSSLTRNSDPGNCPVDTVSWNDVAKFCIELDRNEGSQASYALQGEAYEPKEGSGYRLPTAAEWEFAARAGTTTHFWSGTTEEDVLESDHVQGGEGTTQPVGLLKPNPFGLFDVHGNVQEWTNVGMYDYVDQSAIDPKPPLKNEFRAVRGGNYYLQWAACRSASRYVNKAHLKGGELGMRVTLSVEAVKAAIAADSGAKR